MDAFIDENYERRDREISKQRDKRFSYDKVSP
jgi:hypothetical protein